MGKPRMAFTDVPRKNTYTRTTTHKHGVQWRPLELELSCKHSHGIEGAYGGVQQRAPTYPPVLLPSCSYAGCSEECPCTSCAGERPPGGDSWPRRRAWPSPRRQHLQKRKEKQLGHSPGWSHLMFFFFFKVHFRARVVQSTNVCESRPGFWIKQVLFGKMDSRWWTRVEKKN